MPRTIQSFVAYFAPDGADLGAILKHSRLSLRESSASFAERKATIQPKSRSV